MQIRLATLDDQPALTALATRTFEQTFADSNTPDDMAAYLAANFGVAQQRAELNDPRVITLVAEAEGQLTAYALLREGPAEACVTGAQPIELVRFYVDQAWHGQGVAQSLMAMVDASARARGAHTLWLGVWEHNHRAIRFYTKHGFTDVGSHDFLVGQDRQTDRIMVRGVKA